MPSDDKKVELEAPFSVDWKAWKVWEPISLEWIPHPSTIGCPPKIAPATLLYHGCPSEFGETIINNGFKQILVNKRYGTMKFDGIGHNFYIDSRKPPTRPKKNTYYGGSSSEDTDEDEDDEKKKKKKKKTM